MRILHVYHDFWPARGGIQDHLAGLSRAQAAGGAEVTVLCANDQAHTVVTEIWGVRVVRAGSFGRYYAPFCPAWPLWLRRLRADLVHVHLPSPLAEWCVALVRPSKQVVSLHNDYVRPEWALDAPPAAPGRAAPCRCDRRGSAGLCAKFGRAGWPPQPGADRAIWHRLKTVCVRDWCSLRRLVRGAVMYYKGLEVLLEAATQVTAPLTIAGDGPWRRRLETKSRQVGLQGRARFLGALPEQELINQLQANQVFAFPSTGRGEAFGIAQLKAMACGMPVVSSDLPGVAWLNRHGETGLTVPAREPAALAAALMRIVQDFDQWRRLSAGAVARAREFDTRRTVAGTQQVYAEVMGG